jgi:hypothetical protein
VRMGVISICMIGFEGGTNTQYFTCLIFCFLLHSADGTGDGVLGKLLGGYGIKRESFAMGLLGFSFVDRCAF